jgi:hypoxanthine phosphoribosyltransferase
LFAIRYNNEMNTVVEAGIRSATDLPHGEILITEAQIANRSEEMASDIIGRYDPDNTLFVPLLKGAIPFTALLMGSIAKLNPHYHPRVGYAEVSTYGEGRQAGAPTMSMSPGLWLPGQTVVVIDEVLDTGRTAGAVEDHYRSLGAGDVHLVVMTDKPLVRKRWQEPTMTGFTLRDGSWVTGMGLDDSGVSPEGNRWLPYVALSLEQPAEPS